MATTNINATTTNTPSNSKRNTKKRIGFLGNMIIAGALTASKGTGYGIGYATETVKDEACYYGKKIKNAVTSTKMAQALSDGYYEGKNDAYYAFTQRANKREEKARNKMDNKAVKAAANEMFEDIFC